MSVPVWSDSLPGMSVPTDTAFAETDTLAHVPIEPPRTHWGLMLGVALIIALWVWQARMRRRA